MPFFPHTLPSGLDALLPYLNRTLKELRGALVPEKTGGYVVPFAVETPPPSEKGIVLFADAATNTLKYIKPDGTIVSL